MKIGILTFHNPSNYGAVFQAYALRKTIAGLQDREVEIINYSNPRIDAHVQLQRLRQDHTLKGSLKKVIALPYVEKKCSYFDAFLNQHGHLSAEAYDRDTIHSCDQVYDTVVFGSDQIWNLKLTGNDWNYYGDFSSGVRKIAYAGSFGNHAFNMCLEKTQECMRKYSSVSCRENVACEELFKVAGIQADHVLDPTLLLSDKDWKSLEVPMKTPDQYILLYLISPQKDDFRCAKQLAKETGLPILYVNYTFKHFLGVRNLGAVSPENFLYLLRNATYVVTNSFHGTVLSINMHKDFYCQLPSRRGKVNMRALEVLERFGLKHRCLFDGDSISARSVEEWDFTEKVLNKERQKSIDYLRNALELNHEQKF